MKTILFLYVFFAVLCVLTACGPSPLRDEFTVTMPQLPTAWEEVLGQASWHLEWYDKVGKLQSLELRNTANSFVTKKRITILTLWPNAILARPYWPEKALLPGLFYPAGALYPFDVRQSTIALSWQGGVDAYFFREMDKLRSLNPSNRQPEYFDWQRFRALLLQEAPEDLRANPWLADWKQIAERTVNSGFRSSYLKAESRIITSITLPHDGPWIGASPFAAPLQGRQGESINLPLGASATVLVCPGGVLYVSREGQVWSGNDD